MALGIQAVVLGFDRSVGSIAEEEYIIVGFQTLAMSVRV
jgi:hypothetical protein